jgi:hypothetical protein
MTHAAVSYLARTALATACASPPDDHRDTAKGTMGVTAQQAEQ